MIPQAYHFFYSNFNWYLAKTDINNAYNCYTNIKCMQLNSTVVSINYLERGLRAAGHIKHIIDQVSY